MVVENILPGDCFRRLVSTSYCLQSYSGNFCTTVNFEPRCEKVYVLRRNKKHIRIVNPKIVIYILKTRFSMGAS